MPGALSYRSMSTKSSTAVGVVVALLIVGAVATLGYYQFEVAPGLNSTSTSTSSTGSAVDCTTTPSQCRFVNITSGASAPYSGWTQGSTTLYGYAPLSIKIMIGVNNTIVWTNLDSAFHTATEVSGPQGTSFDSGCIDGQGAPCPPGTGAGTNKFQYTFTVAGTYTYHCFYHSWMIGSITVVAGSASTSTASSAGSSTSSASTATTQTSTQTSATST